MKKDIQILPQTEGDVHFQILGAAEDSGFMLLQRLYVLLLASVNNYRSNISGNTLLDLLEGGNAPSDGAMTSFLAIGCANAVEALDPEDRARVSSFTGVCTDGSIICTLKFSDGTTLKGVFANG